MVLKSTVFHNVKSKQTGEDAFTITFDLTLQKRNYTFHFFLKKEEGQWIPKEIHHAAFSHQEDFFPGKCSLCQNYFHRCDFLTKHAEKVLRLLKDHPTIRLHLLF